MIYKEEHNKDLFSTINYGYFLTHCISADFGMGKGIAIEFNKRFNIKNKLNYLYPDYFRYFINNNLKGDCILESGVFNLITKERYYDKPTYKSLTDALKSMKYICAINTINKIAIPLIGCGLDKLSWNKVSSLIKSIFCDMDIEILVCIK